ncbi:MAG: hypothetical protein U1E62_26615 [Alsobacter sp.]
MAGKKIETAATAFRSALAETSAELGEVRARIAELGLDREELLALPVDKGEARRRVREAIAAAQARGRLEVGQSSWANVRLDTHTFDRLASEACFDIWAKMDPARLEEVLVADCAPGGISAGERSARLEEIDTERSLLEVREELLARELEAASGSPVARRPDAPGELLLVTDDALRAAASEAV